jgi:hypothetical protein
LSFIGDILGGITGSNKAAKQATKASQYATDTNNALARDIFQQTTGRLDPYSQSGLQAQQYYNALLGLPSDVSQEEAQGAFQNYLGNFGFQNELDNGSQAIIGNQASRRLLGSGSTLKGLQRFGLGLRDQYRGNFLNSIGNQQAGGLQAASALAGVGSQYTGQVSANNNQNAQTIGNAALARAGSNTNFLSGLISSAAMLSDERAKTITAKLGELEDGLPIYRFTYHGSDVEHVGPLAQDVALYRPWALGPPRDGMMTILPEMLEAA